MSQETAIKKTGSSALVGSILLGAAFIAIGWFITSNGVTTNTEHSIQKAVGIHIEFGKLLGTIGIFVAMFKVADVFFLAPLFEAINGRTSELENTFSETENLRAEMTQIKSDYEKRITETEANAREQIQAQIKEAQDLKKELMADAQRKAEDYKSQAMNEIDTEKRKALTDLRLHVTTLSLQATEKLLGENVDNDRNRKIIDDFLATVEVKN
jgi:F-type H+-transporting ATPase subunit b